MPFKLATGKNISVSHLHVLFYPCVVRKATAHLDKKALNILHQAQRVFAIYLLELHSIKNYILCTYHTQGR